MQNQNQSRPQNRPQTHSHHHTQDEKQRRKRNRNFTLERPADEFNCPMNKNHKLSSGYKLRTHIMKCKELTHIEYFYLCGYNNDHIFISAQDRLDHYKVCCSKHQSSINFSEHKIKNLGYSPTARPYKPSKDQMRFYKQNKRRLEIEQQVIKQRKAELRIEAYNPDSAPIERYRRKMRDWSGLPTLILSMFPTSDDMALTMVDLRPRVCLEPEKEEPFPDPAQDFGGAERARPKEIEIEDEEQANEQLKEFHQKMTDYHLTSVLLTINENMVCQATREPELVPFSLDGDRDLQQERFLKSLSLFFEDQVSAKYYVELLDDMTEHGACFKAYDKKGSLLLVCHVQNTLIRDLVSEDTDIVVFLVKDNFSEKERIRTEAEAEKKTELLALLKKDILGGYELEEQSEAIDQLFAQKSKEKRSSSDSNNNLLAYEQSLKERTAQLEKNAISASELERLGEEINKKEAEVDSVIAKTTKSRANRTWEQTPEFRDFLKKAEDEHEEIFTKIRDTKYKIARERRDKHHENLRVSANTNVYQKQQDLLEMDADIKEIMESHPEIVKKYWKMKDVVVKKKAARKTVAGQKGQEVALLGASGQRSVDLTFNWEGDYVRTSDLCTVCFELPKSVVFDCGCCCMCYVCAFYHFRVYGSRKCPACGKGRYTGYRIKYQ